MTDIELRDSIAKELYIHGITERNTGNVTVDIVAKIAFDMADVFMEEKLNRTYGTREQKPRE